MNTNDYNLWQFGRKSFVTLSIFLMTILTIQIGISQSSYASTLLESPLPIPVPISKCIAAAIESIATRYDLPAKILVAGTEIGSENGVYIGNNAEEWVEFPASGQRACITTVYDTLHEQPYKVTLNQEMQPVNLSELESVESTANEQKCGKFDAVLCRRWREIDESKELEIAIWLEDIDQSALYDEVAAHYPPGLQAVKGDRFDITRPDYERALAEWEKLLVEAYKIHNQPILDFLSEKKATSISSGVNAPVVFVKGNKSLVDELSKRDDVMGIYLLEGEFKDAMDSATGTQRVSRFWQAGNTGSTIRVAVVEDDPVDFTNIYLDHVNGGTGPAWLSPYSDDMEHPTVTAGVIAMRDHPQYQGMSPNVTLFSADAGDYSPQSNLVDATTWAVNDQNVDVLNLSFSNQSNSLDFFARYFDHVVWNLRRTSVASTGNDSGSVKSPGTGYNLISVGAITDTNDANWSNDAMYGFSNSGGLGARQKPEVVAVGGVCSTDLSADDVGCSGTIGVFEGTSFAAPQVSGLAALVMNQLGQKRLPELVKAIIMASAVHNIEGDRKVSQQDGVGGIDAGLAYAITQRGRYSVVGGVPNGGWYDYQTLTSGSFDGNNAYHYSIPIIRGERIRVVLTYNSHPDSTDPYNNDTLRSDLDLYAYRPNNGSVVTTSLSVANNFEILEFVADMTGNFDIQVKKASWNASNTSEYIGIAWTKQATYLPDVRRENGWSSTLYVDNHDATDQQVSFTYCRHIGNNCEEGITPAPTLARSATYVTTPTLNNSRDSGRVDGSESVSVVSRITKSSNNSSTFDNGIRSSPGDPAFEQVAQTIYVPAFYKGLYNTTTTVYVQNLGTSDSTFTVNYWGRSGYADYSETTGAIPANGVWYAVGTPITAAAWAGSLRIVSSSQPIAVKAQEEVLSVMRSFNGTREGNKLLYVPAAYKKYGNATDGYITTGLVVQNLGTVQTDVKLTFCFQPATPPALGECLETATLITALGVQRAAGVSLTNINSAPVMDGWRGSIKIESLSGQPLAVVVNNVRNNLSGSTIGGYAFNATNYGGRLTILPRASRIVTGSPVISGFTMRNIHTDAVTVKIWYYDESGMLTWDRPLFNLPRAYVQGYYQNSGDDAINLPNGWTGSIVIQSSGPIVTIMREDRATGDSMNGYNGIVLSR